MKFKTLKFQEGGAMPPQEAPAGAPEAGGAPAGAPAEGGPEAGGSTESRLPSSNGCMSSLCSVSTAARWWS